MVSLFLVFLNCFHIQIEKPFLCFSFFSQKKESKMAVFNKYYQQDASRKNIIPHPVCSLCCACPPWSYKQAYIASPYRSTLLEYERYYYQV